MTSIGFTVAEKPQYYLVYSHSFGKKPSIYGRVTNTLDEARREAQLLIERGPAVRVVAYEGTRAKPMGTQVLALDAKKPRPTARGNLGKYFNFWIRPDGRAYGFWYYMHSDVESRLVHFGELEPVPVQAQGRRGAFMGDALSRGWLRLSRVPYGSTDITILHEPTQKQLDTLFDIAEAHRSSDASYVKNILRWISRPYMSENFANPDASDWDILDRAMTWGGAAFLLLLAAIILRGPR